MPLFDTRIDDYIFQSADFAKPILNYLRSLVHQACPNIKETIKWSFPNFEYNGRILCSMASFKQHCAFNFWLAAQMEDPDKILTVAEKTSMGNLGAVKSVADLPAEEVLIKYIHAAMALSEAGVKIQKKEKASKIVENEIPGYFLEALRQNETALATFQSFSPSHKREYLEWITQAKTEATRTKRIATTIKWLLEGKSRNWKYEKREK